MKSKLQIIITAISLLSFPIANFAQVTLGPAASKFALFTNSGAVGDNASAHSRVTGDVGTSGGGLISGFGNVNGVMHNGADAATAACSTALGATITQINALPATLTGPLSLGSGGSLTPGVWSIPGNATITSDLFIDAQNNPSSQFIIKVAGTLSTASLSRVKLINGALACNVFWKVTGAVTMASLSAMRGNVISGGAISMGSGDSLEGRMFSTPAGAISIDGITAFTPVGCNSTNLSGPTLPDLASTSCYAIFSSVGAINGNAASTAVGDVGNNGGGSITGWAPANITGTLHLLPDGSTAQAAIDLSKLYDTLNAMTPDIQLLYPVQLGHNLVLTPHVYLINSALNGPATLTDSIYLDAQGNANGVFVLKIINGAFTTSTTSRVKLINGAQSKNVFWMVDGAVSISNGSIFRGNIIVSTGAVSMVNTGLVLDGRILNKNGAITTQGFAVTMPSACSLSSNIITQPTNQTACAGSLARFSVVATGTGLAYHWRKGTVNLINGGNISGATSDTLRINPANLSDAAINYNVVVTAGTHSDTSNNVSLTVNAVPTITGTTPGSVLGSGTVTLGATASAGTINWYANPTGGSLLGTGTSFTTPVISVTDTFYVDATFAGCTTASRTAVIATVTHATGIHSINGNTNAVTIYPNPFNTSINITINDASQMNNCEVMIYNILGAEMMHRTITKQSTTLETGVLPSGIYLYKVNVNNKTIQSGKLISQQ